MIVKSHGAKADLSISANCGDTLRMDMQQIIALADANMGIIISVLVAIAVLAALFSLRRTKRSKSRSDDELRFRNVFAMMTEDRRQSLISYYAKKHQCGRDEAMRRAVEDRARDEGRW